MSDHIIFTMQLQFDPASFSVALLALAMAAIQLYWNGANRRNQVCLQENHLEHGAEAHRHRMLKQSQHPWNFAVEP